MHETTTTTIHHSSGRANGTNGHDPVLAALERIEQRLARLEAKAARAESAAAQAPPAVAALVDTVDDVVDGLRARGVDVDERLGTLLQVMDRLTQPAALAAVVSLLDKVEEVRFLLESGVFNPSAVRIVAELGRSLAASSERTPPRVGAFGALRAASDEDVQRALGFMLTLARSFGGSLRDLEAPAARALPEGGAR